MKGRFAAVLERPLYLDESSKSRQAITMMFLIRFFSSLLVPEQQIPWQHGLLIALSVRDGCPEQLVALILRHVCTPLPVPAPPSRWCWQ